MTFPFHDTVLKESSGKTEKLSVKFTFYVIWEPLVIYPLPSRGQANTEPIIRCILQKSFKSV